MMEHSIQMYIGLSLCFVILFNRFPDNVVRIHSQVDDVVIAVVVTCIGEHAVTGEPFVEGKRFDHVASLFLRPFDSREIGLFEAWGLSNTRQWPFSSVIGKFMAVPMNTTPTPDIFNPWAKWILTHQRHCE